MKLQYSNSQLKQDAKYSLDGCYGTAALLMLVYSLVLGAANLITSFTKESLGIYLLLSIAVWFFTVFMALGLRSTMVSFSRGKIPLVSDLFSVGSLYWKELLLQLFLTFVPTLLSLVYSVFAAVYAAYGMWLALGIISLLALVCYGGWIILVFRWALAPYLLLDNPSLSVPKLLKISNLLMKGNFWKWISLELSLIGWMLLSILPIVTLFVTPIVLVTRSCFYNEIVIAYKKSFQPAQEPVKEPEPEITQKQE